MYFYTVLYIFIWHTEWSPGGLTIIHDTVLCISRFPRFFWANQWETCQNIYIYAILFGDGSGSELTFNIETPQNGIIYLFRI